jgi:hypothetical protein
MKGVLPVVIHAELTFWRGHSLILAERDAAKNMPFAKYRDGPQKKQKMKFA